MVITWDLRYAIRKRSMIILAILFENVTCSNLPILFKWKKKRKEKPNSSTQSAKFIDNKLKPKIGSSYVLSIYIIAKRIHTFITVPYSNLMPCGLMAFVLFHFSLLFFSFPKTQACDIRSIPNTLHNKASRK